MERTEEKEEKKEEMKVVFDKLKKLQNTLVEKYELENVRTATEEDVERVRKILAETV